MLGDNWPEILAALCVWREARGESWEAKLGVAWVLRNRRDSGKWGGLDQVVLAPRQFSSFNPSDPNASKFPLQDDKSWQDALAAIDQVMFGDSTDPTGGALWYISGESLPPWARLLHVSARIGAFTFFTSK